MTVSKSSININSSLTNVLTNLSANNGGDLNMTSGADTNLIGAKLIATNATINAGDELNIYAVADQYYSYSASSKSRSLSNGLLAGAGIVGFAAVPMSAIYVGAGSAAISASVTNYAFKNSKSSSSTTQTTTNISSEIEAIGNISLNSGLNATIKGSDIIAGGNIDLNSGGELNIISAEDKTYQSSSSNKKSAWGKSANSSELTTITQVASNIAAGGNINIDAIDNVNIKASNLSATNGSIVSQIGNINIENGIDSIKSFNSSKKSGNLSKSKDKVYDYQETAAASNLDFANDLSMSAELGDMNIKGSNLDIANDLNLGTFTIARNLDGTLKTNSNGTFETIGGDSIKNVNITAAELKSEHWEEHKSSSINPVNVVKAAIKKVAKQANKAVNKVQKLTANIAGATGIEPLEKVVELQNDFIDKEQDYIQENVTQKVAGKNPKDRAIINTSSSKTSSSTTTQASSIINVGGNLMMNTSEDVTIKASNLNITGNALINTGGNLLITSAAETGASSRKDQELAIGELTTNVDISHVSASAGIKGSGTGYEEQQQASTQKSSNINIGGSLLSNSAGDTTLVASNLNVDGDAIVKTGGNFNLKDAADTTSLTSKASTLSVEVGVKVGNAYVDAGYAWKAVIDAQLKVVDAVKKLEKMKKLQSQGKASSKAVNFAVLQVTLATAQVASATIAASAATAGAASAASSSFGTGMYGAAYMNTIATGIKNTNTSLISKASNFTTGGSIDIAANNDANIIGSMMESLNGNVSLDAGNDIFITAGENRLTSSSKQESNNLGVSVGNNGVQVSVGHSQGESDYTKTYYTNSQINSANGTTTLTSGNDTNISGANLLAQNMILNVGNNLNVESKQTQEDSNSSGFGFNIGVGVGSGGGGSVGAGFNMNNSTMTRTWTDNETTLIATGAMQVNTGKDLNLTGAAILSDNMTLNITGDINKTDLQDKYYSESMSLGVQANVGIGGSSGKTNNGVGSGPTGTGQSPSKTAPSGSFSINGSYAENEASRTVYATIGGLDSTLVSETKTMTGGDFEGGLTVDLRLFSESGRASIKKDFKELPANVGIIKDNVYKVACEICFVNKEVNNILAKSHDGKDRNLTTEQKDILDQFVDTVEKETGKDIEGMTNDKRIFELNKLKNKDGALTEREMKYRDALWATATDDPKWEVFRDGHIDQISKAIVKDPNYIQNKNKWGVMKDLGKLDYINNITSLQQNIFGDKRNINVSLFKEEPKNLGNGHSSVTEGSYSYKENTLYVNSLSPNYNNFYSVVNTSTHEYGGHGYQDFAVENKLGYLKQNPQFSNTINLFELNYNQKVRAMMGGITYNDNLHQGIYMKKPNEVDAFHIGDDVESKLKSITKH